MNTVVCTFGLFLLLASSAWSQNAPVPAIPARKGRMTKVDDCVYVDLSKVKMIKGGIAILYQTGESQFSPPKDATKQSLALWQKQMTQENSRKGNAVLPLTKEGIKQAMEIVKQQITLLTPGKEHDQLEFTAVIHLDDTTVVMRAGSHGHPITDAATAEQTLNALHQRLTEILKLAE
jgi:hypothetical protein